MEALFLVVCAFGGDGTAFETLYKRYAKAVRNCIAAGMFPSLHHRHLDDVCQDAWLLIWKHLREYKPAKASFAAFARYWAHIALLRWLAKRRRVGAFFDALMEHRRRYPGMESEELRELENLVLVDPFAEWFDVEALAAEADEAIGKLLRTKSHPLEILSLLLTMFREFPPRKIAARLSRETLWSVTNLVARQVRRETHLSRSQIQAHFGALRKLLRARVENVMKGRRYRRLVQRRRGTRVGDLRLREFYTGRVKGGRAAEIVKWRASAVARLRQLARHRLVKKT